MNPIQVLVTKEHASRAIKAGTCDQTGNCTVANACIDHFNVPVNVGFEVVDINHETTYRLDDVGIGLVLASTNARDGGFEERNANLLNLLPATITLTPRAK